MGIILSRISLKNDYVQLPVILRIFEESQNPVNMHAHLHYVYKHPTKY